MTSRGQAAAEAIEQMTEEELAAWITAGDYSSINGIEISEEASQRIADAVGYPEVVGLGFDIGFGMPNKLASSSGGGTPPHGPGGHWALPGQTHDKPGMGMGSFEFAKFTLADILNG